MLEVIQRHKLEKKELLAECQRLKHGVPKGDKKRKKEIGEKIAQMEAELDAKHQQELLALNANATNTTETSVEEVTDAFLTLDASELEIKDEVEMVKQQKKPSKAQKRREKKSMQQREREERVKEAELTNLQGPRHQEMLTLSTMLAQRGLQVHQIASDGNCLYNAVCHQLLQRGIEESNETLRNKTALLMRTKKEEFMPFLTNAKTGNPFTPEEFDRYCDDISGSPAWGGHLELRALSEALEIPLEVVQAEGTTIQLGEEYKDAPIILVYQRHTYSLGEHYNSVVALTPVEGEEEEDAQVVR